MTDPLLTQNESLQRRLNNLPEFISYLQTADQIEPWHRKVLGCIVIRLRNNVRHLSGAFRAPYELEYAAWATRNLLELAVWAKYTTASKESAKRLSDDQVIDMAELQKGMLSLLNKYEPNHTDLATLQEQGEWFKNTKGEMGIDQGSRHLNVGQIAKDVGIGDLFHGFNSMLSKLVHPTSFSIMLDLDANRESHLRRVLCALGQGAAEDSLKDLISHFDSVGIDSSLLRP